MTKSELIEKIAAVQNQLSAKDVELAIKTMLDHMADALARGDRVEIRGFGRWYCKKLKENFNARNPLTNQLIYKPDRVKVRFKPAKKLNKLINK